MENLLIQPISTTYEEFLEFAKLNSNVKFEIVDFAILSILQKPELLQDSIDFYTKVEDRTRFETMHGAFIDLYLQSDDNCVRKNAEDKITWNFEIAKIFGVKNIIFHSNYIPQLMRASYKDNWLDRSAELYSSLINKFSIGVFIENVFDWQPEPLKLLIEKVNSPKFKVCLDTGHLNYFAKYSPLKFSLADWINVLGTDIKYLHLNDNLGDFDSEMTVGSGTFEWKEFSELLIKNKISAQTVFEVPSLQSVTDSINFLKNNKFYPFNA